MTTGSEITTAMMRVMYLPVTMTVVIVVNVRLDVHLRGLGIRSVIQLVMLPHVALMGAIATLPLLGRNSQTLSSALSIAQTTTSGMGTAIWDA
jgi:hypothetical protein